jgi:polyhydroxybutyrate depolymerase
MDRGSQIPARQFLRANSSKVKAIWMALLLMWCMAPAGCAASASVGGGALPRTANDAATTVTAITTPQPDPRDRLVVTTGCGKPSVVPPGTSSMRTISADPSVSNGHTNRTYLVHVPASYLPDMPMPVVLAFHGYGGTAAGMESSSGFSLLAEQQGLIAVYPQGLPDGGNNPPFWASAGPVDFGIDEIAYVTNLLNDLQSRFCVDAHRIYATGFSNGGGMTGYLACRIAGRIAAFAPASGNYYDIPGHCHPSRPAPILEFHGTADGVVPYDGIPASQSPDWPLPSIPEWLAGWAAHDGCTSGLQVFLKAPHVTGERWTGCRGTSIVMHYRLDGVGHTLPRTINGMPTPDIIWNFFQAHPLS